MLVAQEACGHHITQPHYRQMLLDADVLDAQSERRTLDRLIEAGAILAGTPEEITAQLQDIARAGVDEVVLDVTAISSLRGRQEALEDIELVLSAWHASTTAQ